MISYLLLSVAGDSTTQSPDAQYAEAIEVVENQGLLPQMTLTNLKDIATDDSVEITTWSRHELSSGVQKYDLWLTIPADFTSNMINAINSMTFSPDMHDDEIHTRLANRINQHLGMSLDSAEHLAARKIWRGRTPLKQAQPGTDNVGIFRPCLESPDFTKTTCSYVDPFSSYAWARNWAESSWTTAASAFPWTGDGYTFDWGKHFEFGSAHRQKPTGSQELVVLGTGTSDGEGTVIDFSGSQDPVAFFCEACVDANQCSSFLQALKVTSKSQCNPTLLI